jgi:hypothetical protein
MIMRRKRFRQLFVDPKIQGSFLLRVLLYWFLCLAATGTALMCWTVLVDPGRALLTSLAEFWSYFGPFTVVSALMLPILLIDCLRLTYHLAGPMYRFRREMRNLANGDPADPIHLRAGDFWLEFAEQYNAVRRRILLMDERLNAGHAGPSVSVELSILKDSQMLQDKGGFRIAPEACGATEIAVAELEALPAGDRHGRDLPSQVHEIVPKRLTPAISPNRKPSNSIADR